MLPAHAVWGSKVSVRAPAPRSRRVEVEGSGNAHFPKKIRCRCKMQNRLPEQCCLHTRCGAAKSQFVRPPPAQGESRLKVRGMPTFPKKFAVAAKCKIAYRNNAACTRGVGQQSLSSCARPPLKASRG